MNLDNNTALYFNIFNMIKKSKRVKKLVIFGYILLLLV